MVTNLLNETGEFSPDFSTETLGAAEALVLEIAEATSAPVDFVALCLLIITSGLIGNKRTPSVNKAWIEGTTSLRGVMVGAPSSGKSPVLSVFAKICRAIEARLADGHDARMIAYSVAYEQAKRAFAEWEGVAKEAAERDLPIPFKPASARMPGKPEPATVVLDDTTYTPVVKSMAANPAGVIVIKDELRGWFESFSRFGSSDLGTLHLNSWNGGRYEVKRADETVVVERMGLAVVGGIQPKVYAGLVAADHDGTFSRYIEAYKGACGISMKVVEPDLTRLEDALWRLAAGLDGYTVVTLSAGAAKIFGEWRQTNHADTELADDLIAARFGKFPGIALRLACTLAYLWWAFGEGDEPAEIGVPAMAAALALIEEYFKPTSRLLLGGGPVAGVDSVTKSMARWLLADGVDRVNLRQLRRSKGRFGARSVNQIDAAIDDLVAAGWLLPMAREHGSLGRPSKDFTVNQAIRTLEVPNG